ncbi:glycoside hydrolase/deacetylase [Violaceomyces palustris]|uniref:Glycoside hydrolase/deacetylase n=1 Tax=Violaceomyces palustris TaxID=1673888 RepID=A0ACD0NS73_9BASI|nr:glycoside hydrolase/deacetylase [Violaceomyces palustris]
MDVSRLIGHCFCKKLAFTIDISSPSNLTLSAACHCSQCQRLNGAPFIYTTHWKKNAVTWFPQPEQSQEAGDEQHVSFSPAMQTFESIPGRKWKLRCKDCGTPMGSWNSAKQQWSIWPTTLERSEDLSKIPGFDMLKPKCHQFYGPWRSIEVNDELPKWDGYAEESNLVDSKGNVIRPKEGSKSIAFNPHVPRRMIGYGENPPRTRWPGNARLALSFVLNYEEGGENHTLNGDTYSELYLTEYGAANGKMPPANVRNLSVESAYEFGSQRGFWRILDLFKRMNMRFTSWSVGRAVEQNPQAVRAMEEAGCEVSSHSYRWFDHSTMSEEEERKHIRAAIKAIKEASPTGREPRGWYTGRQSINTRRLVYEAYKEIGLEKELYDSDAYDEDLPYWVPAPDGTPDEHLLVIPYTLDNNDMRFAITPGFINSETFSSYLIDAFECLIAETKLDPESASSVPKMMSVGLHCRVVGRPGRFAGLEKFLSHVKRRNEELLAESGGEGGGVWVATRQEIAEHWRANHPPQN